MPIYNSNINPEINFSSNNSRMFKTDEFNSVQNNFNYNVQMGFTYKISSMIKNCQNPQTTQQISFLENKLQESDYFEDISFNTSFPYNMKEVKWQSPKKFLNEEICLFPKDSNGIFMPCDINNNAFISAMNLLLNNPSLLSRLFENEQINEIGIYGVWLCENGIWKLFLIDDKMPIYNSNYVLNEFSTKEKCLFHMILQKALAKFYQSYEKLLTTNISTLLNDLTGSQTEIKSLFDFQSNEDIWTLLKKWKDANYMIFFQNNGSDFYSEKEQSLCFSLMDCIEIIPTNENESLEKVLKLKTPLKGAMRDEGKFKKNANLSKELKKKLKFNESDEMSFYLTLEEIFKIFTEVGVCKAQNKFNSIYNCITVKNTDNFFIKFHLETSGNAVLSFNQKEDHCLRVLLAKETGYTLKDSNLQFIAGDYANKKIFMERNNMEAGDYLIVIETLWSEGDREITIGCWCENENMGQNLNFEVIPKKNGEILETQKLLMKNYAKTMESNTMRVRDYSSSNEPMIKM